MRLSYSALDTFKTCPLKFKFQEIDKIKTPKSKEAVFGTLIHDCLRMLHEPRRLVSPTQEELLQYFSQNWNPDIYDNQQEEVAFFDQGVRLLKKYYEQNQPADFNIIDLEARFEAPIIVPKETHLITGKIDRVDKTEDNLFEIIDYKTAKKMPAFSKVAKDLQLAVYQLGAVARWPSLEKEKRPIKVSLYYLKHGEKLSTIKEFKDLLDTRQKITEFIENIKQHLKKNSFEPTPNSLCDWCSYQRFCPFFRHKFEKDRIDDKKIQVFIGDYWDLKKQKDLLKKKEAKLKEIINQYLNEKNLERIFGEQAYITRLTQKRSSYDFQKIKEILEPLGKWEQILKVDNAKLKKAITVLPQKIHQQIESAKKLEKEFKTISVKKIKKPSD